MTTDQIIENARFLKEAYHTDDPYVFAEKFGVEVIFSRNLWKDLKAQIIKFGDRSFIYINDSYDELSRKLLCAHELAHFMFHSMEHVNYYNKITKIEQARMEYEANLFALALLLPEDENYDRICHLNGYLLREIIEANLAFVE